MPRISYRFAPLVAFAIAVAGCAASTPPPANPGPAGIEQWEHNHPEAARELGTWVQEHPDAAAKFFEWDGHHHEKATEFVLWTIANPGANIDAFVVSHPGWQYFDKIMESHRPAAEIFMTWARHHGPAAQALMNHPGGLDWAGHHLYAASWHMETNQ
jgi:hypothetical protein